MSESTQFRPTFHRLEIIYEVDEPISNQESSDEDYIEISILVKLGNGHLNEIRFPFGLHTDKPEDVAAEMVKELSLDPFVII